MRGSGDLLRGKSARVVGSGLATLAVCALAFTLWPGYASGAAQAQARRLEIDARQLSDAADSYLLLHRGHWLEGEREATLEAFFAAHRAHGSAIAFRRLAVDSSVSPGSLEQGFEIVGGDADEAITQVRHALHSCEQAAHGRSFNRRGHRVLRRALAEFERSFAELGATRGRWGSTLQITELSCPQRKKYTYRMNVCVEGFDLDQARLRVVFVKKMNPARDPWEREVKASELSSSEELADGRDRRCYFLRQIGKDIRLHERDNVYAVLERARGRNRVVEACFDENQIVFDP